MTAPDARTVRCEMESFSDIFDASDRDVLCTVCGRELRVGHGGHRFCTVCDRV